MWVWSLLVLSPIGILASLILKSEQCKLFQYFEKQNNVDYSSGLKCCLTERKKKKNNYVSDLSHKSLLSNWKW